MADIRISDLNALRFVQANKIGYNYRTVDFQNRLYAVQTNDFNYFQKFGIDDILAVQLAVYSFDGKFRFSAKLKDLDGNEIIDLAPEMNGVGDVNLIEIRHILTAENIGLFYVEISTTEEISTADIEAVGWTNFERKVQPWLQRDDIIGEINIGDVVTIFALIDNVMTEFITTILAVSMNLLTGLNYYKTDIDATEFGRWSGVVTLRYSYDIVGTTELVFISEPFEVDGRNNCISKFVYSDSKNYPTEDMFFSTGIEFQLRAETNANQLPQVDLVNYDDQKKKLTSLNSTFYDKVEIFSEKILPIWIARKIKFALGLNECYYNRQLLTLQSNSDIELVEDGSFACTFKFQTQLNEISLNSDSNVTGFDNLTYPSGYSLTCSPNHTSTPPEPDCNLDCPLTDLTESTTLSNITATDTVLQAFGKIKKWFSEFLSRTITITYTDLQTLANSNQLKEGQKYKIIDNEFQFTIGGTSELYTETETIVLTALSNNTFEPIIFSQDFNNDTIWYEFFCNTISRRYDKSQECDVYANFRHQKNRRWALEVTDLWVQGDDYLQGAVVTSGGEIYVALNSITDSQDLDSGWLFAGNNGDLVGINSDGYTLNFNFGSVNIPVGDYTDLPMFVDYSTNINLVCKSFDNIIIEQNCYNFTIEQNCYYFTIEQSCYHFTIGQNCSNFNIEQNCYYFTIEQSCCYFNIEQDCSNFNIEQNCYYFTIGQNCSSFNIGQNCYNFTIEQSCSHFTIGQNCSNFNIEQNCYYFTIEQSCYHFTIGQNCSNFNIEQNCYYFTIGQNCSSFNIGQNCYNFTIEQSCSSFNIGQSCSNFTIGALAYAILQQQFNKTIELMKYGNTTKVMLKYYDAESSLPIIQDINL